MDFLLIIAAGFAAGALNAVAGGGTFLTLPALVFLGAPPVAANATATFTALPGYVSSAWAFRHDLKSGGALSLRNIIIATIIGGLIGAGLLLVTSDSVFSAIVPWLLLAATLIFAAGPALLKALQAQGIGLAGPGLSALVFIGVAIYGGYFNGGLGIVLLAAFGVLGYSDMNAMNGLKNVLSAILSLASAVTFVLAGLIVWEYAIPMAIASTIGGYAGGFYSRKIRNPAIIRGFVVLVGVVMTALFFLR